MTTPPLLQKKAGAKVVRENIKGLWCTACRRGISSAESPDIIVILDADYSDYPDRINLLLDPIVDHGFDMVLGSRTLGRAEKGSLTLPSGLWKQACNNFDRHSYRL